MCSKNNVREIVAELLDYLQASPDSPQLLCCVSLFAKCSKNNVHEIMAELLDDLQARLQSRLSPALMLHE